MHSIGFFTEQGYEGKIDREHSINLRTDSSWISAIDATHHPLTKLSKLPDDLYDVGIMIIPKDRRELLNRPILEHYKRVCKKVTVMQESYYNYWQDSPIDEQIWYFNFLVEMDMIFIPNFNNDYGKKLILNNEEKFISLMLMSGQIEFLKRISEFLDLKYQDFYMQITDRYFN